MSGYEVTIIVFACIGFIFSIILAWCVGVIMGVEGEKRRQEEESKKT